MQQIDFHLRAKEMSKALSPIFKTINRSTVLPQLEAVRVAKSGSKITFNATDLENSLTLWFDSDANNDFDFCIDATSLKKMLSKSIDEVIHISGNETKVSLHSDCLKVRIPSFCSSEYPKIPALDQEAKTLVLNAKSLSEEFSKALKFVSRDELRPSMTGISIRDVKGKIQIAATDAHRLYWKVIVNTPDNCRGLDITIPAKAARLFVDTFKSGEVQLCVDSVHANFIQENKSLLCRVIASKYPDYIAVINHYDFNFCMNRKQLVSFLSLAENFISRSTYMINVWVDQNFMEFDGADVDFSMDFQYKAPVYELSSVDKLPFSFSVNAKFLKEALLINKDEYVKINHSQTATTCMVFDDCILLMPLMRND